MFLRMMLSHIYCVAIATGMVVNIILIYKESYICEHMQTQCSLHMYSL